MIPEKTDGGVRVGEKRVNLDYIGDIRVREAGSAAYRGIDPGRYLSADGKELLVLALDMYRYGEPDVDYSRPLGRIVRAYAEDAEAILEKLQNKESA